MEYILIFNGVHHVEVHGIGLDAQTRCTHYGNSRDVVAIRMKCCGLYYACKDCHQELADHPIAVWPRTEWAEPAVLCGVCGNAMSILSYLGCGHQCPSCQAEFNPGCRRHHHFYFEAESEPG